MSLISELGALQMTRKYKFIQPWRKAITEIKTKWVSWVRLVMNINDRKFFTL